MKNSAILYCSSIFCSLYSIYISAQTQKIAAGSAHSLYTCTNNVAFSCGFNNTGQLGNGSVNNTNTAVQVSGLANVVDISGGYHSLFLKNDGSAWACGYNFYGQLGEGSTNNNPTPVQVSTLNGITSVSAGKGHFSVFLKNDSTVWTCGNNVNGQLGIGSSDGNAHSTPTQVSSFTKVTKISAGGAHCLFIKRDSTVWACGGNGNGVLGDGTIIQRTTPVQVISLNKIISVAAGNGHSLFLKNDGTVWSCGFNGNGQLGNGTSDNNPHVTPTQIITLSGIVAIATGDAHSLFLKNNGTVWACGENSYQQLGDGTNIQRNTPIQVNGLSGITAIAGGYGHSLFLKSDGSVWACGWNANGQIGDGTNTIRSNPVQTTPLCGMIAGLEENYSENEISVYPNPTTDKLFITHKTLNSLRISNYFGQEVYSLSNPTSKQVIDLSSFPSGIYFLKAETKQEQKVFKIIKE